jgi:hypothetical protein
VSRKERRTIHFFTVNFGLHLEHKTAVDATIERRNREEVFMSSGVVLLFIDQ